MKMVKIDPPGSWCHYEAVLNIIRRRGGESFVEVGCGAGDLSLKLCRRGLRGVGIDFSAEALEQARANLLPYVRAGAYRLVAGDIFDLADMPPAADWGISMMVMEHVADDVAFLRKMMSLVRPGGHVMVAVPGRRDRWGIEDETVGHLRRYDNTDLRKVLEEAGLRKVRVLSVAVPVANLLFHVGNLMVRHSKELEKVALPLEEQTKTSGIREIPFKTVFPPWCKLLLNRVTLYPLFVLQRAFYNTNLGLTQIGVGKVAA